ncbi:MAG: hypothetical protein OMM_01598 [Candidatus Magnetoglobus multicellularis str. Araruama]|uniref:TIGR04255 family protein n=1 Tax=Candidatus Magnetoglobus multicellularis str. Araruama TaxID=890399 RepID=A0A1V1PCL8_9BACT|nr:MAG: hypothetical protein OMM_01598 [Candidatus Magnetoglobus multicellularis str. Araruama]
MTDNYSISEIYPNSPLIEVVCEIRFPAELSIDCRKDTFYEKIRDTYPVILIPQNNSGITGSIQPYRFEDKQNTSGLMIGIDRFSYYEKEYTGHKQFIKEFLRIFKLLTDLFNIKKLTRLGWRYINIIPFSREGEIIPVNQFLNLNVQLPEGFSEQFENLSVMFMSKVPEGSITTRIESIIKAADQQEALLLDFDFSMTEKLVISKLNSCVNKAHTQTRHLFEVLITEQYRQYLRGEEI